MTKVEELLADINNALDSVANEINPCFTRDYIGLDDSLAELISAAEAQGEAKGHAEGAAEERERIRKRGTLHDKGQSFPFYSVVASVLTPPKERE